MGQGLPDCHSARLATCFDPERAGIHGRRTPYTTDDGASTMIERGMLKTEIFRGESELAYQAIRRACNGRLAITQATPERLLLRRRNPAQGFASLSQV